MFACVAVIWAAIYLPGLGSLEIKGEEGRRLLPAVAMLETGRWIVPSIGGVDYLAKPPLINWLAAAAFAVAGDTHNEWAARAPSVLAVLALALCTVGALGRWLGNAGALVAALFVLTNIGLMEKGRLAEIEALYLSLTGIAVVLWLGAWQRDVTERGGKPSWRTWTLPWVFLGLGMLTKGPLHLLFFYAVVAGVLGFAGRRRDWLNWPHLVGVVLTLGIFAAWAVPYLQQTAASHSGGVWLDQFRGRMEVNDKFRLGAWLLNIPRGLVNYLPWTVLLPLAWRRGTRKREAVASDSCRASGGVNEGRDASPRQSLFSLWRIDWSTTSPPEKSGDCLGEASLPSLTTGSLRCLTGRPDGQTLDDAIARGLLWAVGGCFLAISLAPGGQPRYTLPLLTPASVLLALVLARGWNLPAWLPTVWARVNAVCLYAVMLAAPVAVAFSSREPWRWVVGLGAAGIAMALFQRVRRWPAPWALTAMSAAVMALITALYLVGAVPILRRSESVRQPGEEINRQTAGERVAVLRPGFVPFLFYLRPAPLYVQAAGDIPPSIHFLLSRDDQPGKAQVSVVDKRTGATWTLRRISPTPPEGL